MRFVLANLLLSARFSSGTHPWADVPMLQPAEHHVGSRSHLPDLDQRPAAPLGAATELSSIRLTAERPQREDSPANTTEWQPTSHANATVPANLAELQQIRTPHVLAHLVSPLGKLHGFLPDGVPHVEVPSGVDRQRHTPPLPLGIREGKQRPRR
jgi:hypothetical protein|eukprot:308453-Prymnesium_polylepis.1